MACGAVVVPPQERRDGGARDGGVEDAGHRDAGAQTDAGFPDSGIGGDGGERDGAWLGTLANATPDLLGTAGRAHFSSRW